MSINYKERKKVELEPTDICIDTSSKFDLFEEFELPKSRTERAEIREIIELILQEKGWLFEYERDGKGEDNVIVLRVYKGFAAS